MLSICIPVYNFDVRALVNDLHRQAEKVLADFEILLMDDASRENYRILNRECKQLDNVVWIELEENVGRSRIRNLLAGKARFSQLIFMDCDSACPDDHYIDRYTPHLDQEGVVYGGRTYREVTPRDSTLLHWTFGREREAKPASVRSKKPNASFMTNNFMIAKAVFQKVEFNEEIHTYGHEDTLFGFELFKKGITIQHTDNPLVHLDLQITEDFITKTETAIDNLVKIYRISGSNPDLRKSVRLLQSWHRLRIMRLDRLFCILFQHQRKRILRNLHSNNPSLFMLDMFKLGTLCTITKQDKAINSYPD